MDKKSEQKMTNKQPRVPPPFHQRFDIEVNSEDLGRAFINRVQNGIKRSFFWLERYYLADSDEYRGLDYSNVLAYVADRLGVEHEYNSNFSDYYAVNPEFYHFLQSLEALYAGFEEYKPNGQPVLASIIKSAISQSEADLGIEWKNGAFWPSGAKLLDEALVNENLRWLSDPTYTSVLEPFQKGLRHLLEAHSKPESLKDTMTDMYEALEALAKIVTGRDRDLSGNADSFISKLGLSGHYKEMLKLHISHANQYRHAPKPGVKRQLPLPNEAEAFVYTTGLFIRLAIQQLTTI